MTIRGSLETFSLPELFQIIESGHKSGRLTFKPKTKNSNPDLDEVFQLWFDKGNFITIVNSLKQQFLTSKIINKGWIDIKTLIVFKFRCPKNKGLGSHLQEQNALSKVQLDLLFKMQVDELIKLFDIESASFKFEEIDNNGKIPSDNETFPWEEITGRQKKATELSLEGMRNFSHWSRFAKDMPLNSNGLQRLIDRCDLHFNSLEKYLCEMADGSASLHKIAIEVGVSNEKIQTTALSMILAGMVEEVPVKASNVAAFAGTNYTQSVRSSAFLEQTNTSVKTKKKSKVSNSLLKNLTNFLRNNF